MAENAPPPGQDIEYSLRPPEEGLSSGAKWGIGCTSGCLLFLLAAGFLGYLAYLKTKEAIGGALDQFSSTTPIVFLAPEVEEGTINDVVARFDAFREVLESGGEAEPLHLSGEDINILIYHHPDWEPLTDKTAVRIEDDQIMAEVSIPLDDLLPMFQGRFLNGEASIRLQLEDGYLEGFIQSLWFNGTESPPELIQELQWKNLFEEAQQDPEFQRMIEQLESIRVEEGVLIIVPKSPEGAEVVPADPAVERQGESAGAR